jgi:hypothetical protein
VNTVPAHFNPCIQHNTLEHITTTQHNKSEHIAMQQHTLEYITIQNNTLRHITMKRSHVMQSIQYNKFTENMKQSQPVHLKLLQIESGTFFYRKIEAAAKQMTSNR